MFFLILTVVATLMHGFLFWHIAALPWLQQGAMPRIVWLAALIIWLVYLLGTFFGHDGSGGLAAWLERLSMDWFGLLFIGFVVMLAVDILSLTLLWYQPALPWLRVAGLVVTVGLVIVALYQGVRAPVITRYEVTLADLPHELDGTRVVALADLHLGSQLGAKWLSERVKQVEALHPDLVVLLGDNFEGHGDPDPALQPVFARLRAPLGVYAVTGNHEHFGDASPAIKLTQQAGVQWLPDRWVELRSGLILAGVDDLTTRWRAGNSEDYFAKVLASAPLGATIVLSHSPLQIKQAAAAGADLVLSGHTHGGQIWPFGLLEHYFYPYLAGRYRVDGTTLVVSRGTGLWGPRMRLWRPGEILLLVLRAG